MEKIEPFERFTNRYEDWFKKNEYAYLSELLGIKKVLPKDKKNIEIGVGSGRFASALGIRVGIDPSKKMLKIALKKGILVIEAVAEDLPFRECSFSFALMITTICFVENINSAFNEAFRILRSKGSLILGFIDKNSSIGKLYQKNKNKNVFYKVAEFYSVKKVINYLKKTGFKFFEFFQTIFRSLGELDENEPVRKGYGQGSFIVVKATK
jgi:ubiquinone/menaquinone biosynthesis C-methylase UbiE